MKKKDIIINYILENINSGKWKPGKRILSEEDIATFNKVSRNTVREATITLTSQGILERRHGSGTYVKENNTKQNYIIILYSNFFFKELVGTTYRYIIEKIKDKFEKNNFIPLLIEFGKEKEYLNIEENKISAIIKMMSTSSVLDEIGTKNNIPIIEFGDDITEFSSVKEDTLKQFTILRELIDKYNFKDILIFTKDQKDYSHTGSVINILHNNYFQSKGYNIWKIKDTLNLLDAKNVINNAFKSLEKIPDLIVFLDDNIYKCGYSIYPTFDKLLKQTKIIVFSNGKETYNPNYKFCKITMNIDNVANGIFSLTLNNINKIAKTKKNIIIEPTIIDEEKLI